MTQRTKSLLAILLLSVFIVSDSKAEVKIGAVVSLQGGAAEQGQNWLDGALLAVDELNKEGIQVKLVTEDDSTQPARAASAFNKVSKVDRVDAVVGGTWDFLVESIFPLAKRDKIFTLSPTNPEEVLSEASTKNPFGLLNSMSIKAGEDVLEPFLRSAGKKRFSLVTMQVPFSVKYSEMYRRVSARLDHEFIEEIEISLEDSLQAYKHAAQKLSRKKPDIIFVVADYPRLDIFMTELENFKVSPIVITTQHLEGAFELSGNNQERYKNCFGIHPKYDRAKFDPLYLKRFNKKPGVFAAEGFDAIQFLARGLSREEKTITGFSYTGLKGAYSYKEGRTSILEKNEAVLVNFQNQKLVEVTTLPGK